jgi:predicted outer membrane lipoprotein
MFGWLVGWLVGVPHACSFALVLWELVTRKRPYENIHTFAELEAEVLHNQYRPTIPYGTSARLAALIEACWSHAPSSRPAFHMIVRQLDHIIVEHALPYRDAQQLWIDPDLIKQVPAQGCCIGTCITEACT